MTTARAPVPTNSDFIKRRDWALTAKTIRSILIGYWLVAGQLVQANEQEHSPLSRFTYSEYHMGVDTRLIVYAPSKEVAEKACGAAFERIAALDTIMSDYQIRSELMQLCDLPKWGAGQPPVVVSPDLFQALQESRRISQLTGGLFDVTVGPLVRLWRKARKTGVLPTLAEIREARARVGWKKMTLDPRTSAVRLAQAGMKLDLGAIGKGYADDAALKVLKSYGVTRALVEMGGDIAVSGPPPGKNGWSIEVLNAEKDDSDADHIATMRFANCAVSTSGDTEEYVIIGGRRYSHVINPLTGQALTHRVQATVVGPYGSLTDPLSTAMTLVNARTRRKLLRTYTGLKVYVKVLK